MRVFIDNGVFVDASTFRDMADHVLDEYFCHFDPADVHDGDVVFVNTFLLCAFARLFHPLIRVRYVLITHNSDYSAPVLAPGYDYTRMLSSRKLIAWFAQNANVRHWKLFPVPQGFSVNTKTLATDWTAELAFTALKDMHEKARPLPLDKRPRWLYVNFAARNESLRHAILDWAIQPDVAHFVTVRSDKVTQQEYREEVASHRFVWCPPGNGLDTHRKYEALQQGTVPLVIFEAGLEDLHRHLPVVTVNRPQAVTLELLQSLVPRYQRSMEELWARRHENVLTATYWQNFVLRSISEARK